jgi:hypothetical protein
MARLISNTSFKVKAETIADDSVVNYETGAIYVSDNKLKLHLDGVKYSAATTVIISESSSNMASISSTSYVEVPNTSVTITQAGRYLALFNSQTSLPSTFITTGFSTVQGITDLASVYSAITALAITDSTHAATFGSETINAGVYSVASAMTITGVLTLDGQGVENSVFVIRSGGAITSSASASVVLINGASAENVHWIAEGGAIALGANTIMKGNLISNGYAVSAGANCAMQGRLLTSYGAISFGEGILTCPCFNQSTIDFLSLKDFIMFTGSGGISNTGASSYTGNIATHLGAITGFSTATVTGTIFPSGSSTTVTEFNPTAGLVFFKNSTALSQSTRINRSHKEDDISINLQADISSCLVGDIISIRCQIDNGILTIKDRILTLISS